MDFQLSCTQCERSFLCLFKNHHAQFQNSSINANSKYFISETETASVTMSTITRQKKLSTKGLAVIITLLINIQSTQGQFPFPPFGGGSRPFLGNPLGNLFGNPGAGISFPSWPIMTQTVYSRPIPRPASPARQCRAQKLCPERDHGTTLHPSWLRASTLSPYINETTTTASPPPRNITLV